MNIKKRSPNFLLSADDFVLHVIEGVDRDMVFTLSKDRMIVGRSIAGLVDIEIHEIYAAQRHFEIFWDESSKCHAVRDLGARNKIYINDHALEIHGEKKLQLDDEIRIGNTKFAYEKAL
jgi:pSer/pThr/pTyr-binding forkhead associated (FHA) protein